MFVRNVLYDPLESVIPPREVIISLHSSDISIYLVAYVLHLDIENYSTIYDVFYEPIYVHTY
jgi:hypothetical protein